MASTARRWMHVTDLTIGGISFNDARSYSGGVEGQEVGSNSEKDTHANHFLTIVQLTERATFSVYDMTALRTLRSSYAGKKAGISFKVPCAADGPFASATCGFTFTATTTYCRVQSISYQSEHDTEAAGDISIAFASTGTGFGLTITAN